ncbi:MAG: tetratricopeptide repeat protein [Pseudohongiella sp.]|nr:tetratricopeptide repeat protein [Pseudohongiella sp.]
MLKQSRPHSVHQLLARNLRATHSAQPLLKGVGGTITFFLLSSLAIAQAPDGEAIQRALRNTDPLPAQDTRLPCPDMTDLLPGPETDWVALRQHLSSLMSRCLQSPDYFALMGAAQLNSGQLSEALESLERALLLDPENGAAQIDYAEALYHQGQLFTAMELNQQILRRQDVPDNVQNMLAQRQHAWRGLTRQWNVQGDLLTGYDSNLNGAPSPDQITLTLSGDSVVLPLNPDFQAVEGSYMNMRLGARYRQLAPRHQHNVVLELRGRVSEDSASDLLQLDTRYAFIKPEQNRSWQVTGGMSHLFFGGSPLYTATEVGGRYQFETSLFTTPSSSCRPNAAAATQHQLFHNQSRLNAIESKMSTGLNCQLITRFGRQQFLPEIGLLSNSAVRSNGTPRAGGTRRGWQANIDWQLELPKGLLITQLNHTQMDDSQGYSPLLANGAQRWVKRSYVLLQYRQPLAPRANLLLNLYHQQQHSNLELFQSEDSSIEIGINYTF